MVRAARRRRSPRRKAPLVVTAVLAALAVAVVAVLLPRPSPRPLPHGAVATPAPSPPVVRTPLLLPLAGGTAPTSAGLQRALAAVLAAPGLGRGVVLSILVATTGEPVLERGATRAVIPASTVKIATAVAALTVLPADRRLTTRVVAGPRPGDVVLVGAGDPTLAGRYPAGGYPAVATLAGLARQVRATGTVVRRVLVDDSVYVGPRLGPGWKPGYVSGGDVAPVSALEVDGGRVGPRPLSARAADPALDAGRQLARLLGVVTVVRGSAVAGARQLGAVFSPTVAQLVQAMLTRSDNDLAETLGRQVALEVGQPASFAGEAAAMGQVLRPILTAAGLVADAIRLQDSSGLSVLNRVQPAALTRLLALSARGGRLAPVLFGLPVAGFDGTLEKRFRTAPTSAAAGQVWAKTGTLDGVSALAGLVRTRSGVLLAFDLTADGVPVGATLGAQRALDTVAAVLAGCGCA